MSLTTTHLAGFCWLNSAAAATATATATATGTTITVTTSGTNTSTTSSNSISYTVPAGGIPSGSTIVIGVMHGSNGNATGASDSAGNTYSVDLLQSGDGGEVLSFLHATNISALTSGQTITVTFSKASDKKAIVTAYATGLTTGSALDKTTGSSGTDEVPSSGATAVTSQASELAVGGLVLDRASTVTEPSGYTVISSATVSSRKLSIAYRVLTSTGAQTYAPTLSASSQWGCAVMTLKGA